MSGKKITMKAKPTQAIADAWVESRDLAAEEVQAVGEGRATPTDPVPMKRLTIDIPASLHRKVKSQCALDGVKIADVVREILFQKYGTS